MRLKRIATVVLAVSAGALLATVPASPAAAGGWAATVLDPVPERIESGRAYEIGFWMLQHGTHPYDWPDPLGHVGLALIDDGGATVTFPGRELAEPAHYVAMVTVPHDGTWRVVGIQGHFQPYDIGPLQVPGTATALGVPAAPGPADIAKYWPGPVRPPVLPVDQTRDPYGGASAIGAVAAASPVASAAPAAPAASAAEATPSRRALPELVAVVLIAIATGLGLFAAARRRTAAGSRA
jgi:hypothetical protein